MSRPAITRKRLLIGAGSLADAASALQLAEILVLRQMASDLGGLMVEDPAWLSFSERPAGKLVTFGGEVTGAPSPQAAARLVEREARAFREKLELLARRRRVEWSFDQQTGDLVANIVGAAPKWDVVLIGHGRLQRGAGRVVWLSPADPDAAQEVRDIADTVARGLGTEAVAFALDEADAPATPQTRITFPDPDALLAGLSRTYAAAVITDIRAGPFADAASLRALVDAARCPVLLLGADPASAGRPEGQ
ncbi:hypothetical protein [Roseovarius salinarum]|uniref:hypothetical protein n=1 Tax=Roseovarius salinarum TaxID=1981892 RepID=UPI000C34EE15|nr:hypothetical protein [Roseovarius salinarum]